MQAWIDAARATPEGEKKRVEGEMPKGYAPKAVEAAWWVGLTNRLVMITVAIA